MKTLILSLFIGAAFAQDPAPVAPITTEVPVVVESIVVPATPVVEPIVVPATPAVPSEVKPEEVAGLPEVTVPENEAQALKDVQDSVNAIQMGQWGTLAVLLVGLAIFAYNKFVKKSA